MNIYTLLTVPVSLEDLLQVQAFRRSQTNKGQIIIIYAHTNVPPTRRRFCKPFISTQEDSPEIHPPGFMLLKSRHLTSAQWSHMPGHSFLWLVCLGGFWTQAYRSLFLASRHSSFDWEERGKPAALDLSVTSLLSATICRSLSCCSSCHTHFQ